MEVFKCSFCRIVLGFLMLQTVGTTSNGGNTSSSPYTGTYPTTMHISTSFYDTDDIEPTGDTVGEIEMTSSTPEPSTQNDGEMTSSTPEPSTQTSGEMTGSTSEPSTQTDGEMTGSTPEASTQTDGTDTTVASNNMTTSTTLSVADNMTETSTTTPVPTNLTSSISSLTSTTPANSTSARSTTSRSPTLSPSSTRTTTTPRSSTTTVVHETTAIQAYAPPEKNTTALGIGLGLGLGLTVVIAILIVLWCLRKKNRRSGAPYRTLNGDGIHFNPSYDSVNLGEGLTMESSTDYGTSDNAHTHTNQLKPAQIGDNPAFESEIEIRQSDSSDNGGTPTVHYNNHNNP